MLHGESFTTGRIVRLMRLGAAVRPRMFVLPLDHSVSDGPIARPEEVDDLLAMASASGVDAVVVHKGRAATIAPSRWQGVGMIVHLSASTSVAPDPDAKVLVSSVEDALRLGADAVSIHTNVGAANETQQLRDASAVIADCRRYEMPLLAMMYPRGGKISSSSDPDHVAHCATLAAELGADIVKVPYTGSPLTMRQVVESCPIPILVAGGPAVPSLDALERYAEEIVESEAAGVAIGRNIFRADDPGLAARRVAAIIHSREPRVMQTQCRMLGHMEALAQDGQVELRRRALGRG